MLNTVACLLVQYCRKMPTLLPRNAFAVICGTFIACVCTIVIHADRCAIDYEGGSDGVSVRNNVIHDSCVRACVRA